MTDVSQQQPAPVDVVRSFFDEVADNITPALADRYAADAVVVQPFAPGGPNRIVGRANLRRHFAARTGGAVEVALRDLVLRGTDDPAVVIAEYDYAVTNTKSGVSVITSNIQVFHVDGDRIVATRDFHDHVRMRSVLDDPH